MWEYNKKLVGERIRCKRQRLNYTQENMAERLELSVKFIADIERGATGMSLETMFGICEMLMMTPNALLMPETEDGEEISALLARCTPQQRKYAREIVEAFCHACEKEA